MRIISVQGCLSEKTLDEDVSVLNPSARLRTSFKRYRINKIRDIIDRDRAEYNWNNIRNLGIKTYNELKDKVFLHTGYRMRMWQ